MKKWLLSGFIWITWNFMNTSWFCFLEIIIKFNVVGGRHRETQIKTTGYLQSRGHFSFYFLQKLQTSLWCQDNSRLSHYSSKESATERKHCNFMSCVPLYCSSLYWRAFHIWHFRGCSKHCVTFPHSFLSFIFGGWLWW